MQRNDGTAATREVVPEGSRRNRPEPIVLVHFGPYAQFLHFGDHRGEPMYFGCDDTEFVTLGGLVVGPKPFGTKGL